MLLLLAYQYQRICHQNSSQSKIIWTNVTLSEVRNSMTTDHVDVTTVRKRNNLTTSVTLLDKLPISDLFFGDKELGIFHRGNRSQLRFIFRLRMVLGIDSQSFKNLSDYDWFQTFSCFYRILGWVEGSIMSVIHTRRTLKYGTSTQRIFGSWALSFTFHKTV